MVEYSKLLLDKRLEQLTPLKYYNVTKLALCIKVFLNTRDDEVVKSDKNLR